MNWRHTNLLLTTLLLALSSQMLGTSSENRWLAAIVGTDGSAAPIEITSIKGTLDDLLAGVSVYNLTNKNIVSFRFKWNMRDTVPATIGVSAGIHSYGTSLTNEISLSVPPHEKPHQPTAKIVRRPS